MKHVREIKRDYLCEDEPSSSLVLQFDKIADIIQYGILDTSKCVFYVRFELDGYESYPLIGYSNYIYMKVPFSRVDSTGTIEIKKDELDYIIDLLFEYANLTKIEMPDKFEKGMDKQQRIRVTYDKYVYYFLELNSDTDISSIGWTWTPPE